MLTLRVNFPWGRYYAHPWGQNPVRIAEAEWPPSPWRLLRALAAAWFRKHPGQQPSSELVEMLESLGQQLPLIELPKVNFSKTVHYQPSFENSAFKRVRHENHFVAVGGDVRFQWQLESANGHSVERRVTSQLEHLVREISYFGRAESLSDVSVERAEETLDESRCARVVINDEKPGRRIASDCRDVFCPDPNDFRARDLWSRRSVDLDGRAAPRHLVQDLLDAAQPLPDGGAWFSFQMPDGWPEKWVVRYPTPPKRKQKPKRIIARYLEFSLQCRIPVPVKHVVSIAELFRRRAIQLHGKPSFALSGHAEDKNVVANNHQHAFYLAKPDEADGGRSLSRLVIWCEHGFTQQEVNALMSVETLRWADARFPARPILLHMSRELPESPIAKRWKSQTPFVPPRYWYRKKVAEGRVRDGHSPEDQIIRCLTDNGIDVDCQAKRLGADSNRAWDVCKVHLPKSARKKNASNSQTNHRIGVFIEVEFDEPTRLSVPAMGHSCHFGLGQFVPANA